MFRTLQVSDPQMKKILIDVESSQASTSKESLLLVNVSLRRGDESCFRCHDPLKTIIETEN